jgi:hypothetical protein
MKDGLVNFESWKAGRSRISFVTKHLLFVNRWNDWTAKYDAAVATRSWWSRKSHGFWRKVMSFAADVNDKDV